MYQSITKFLKVSMYIIKLLEIPKDLPTEEKEKIMLDNEILKKDLEQYAVTTSNLFSRFRVIYYSSVIKKILSDLIEKKTPSNFILKLNNDNLMYILPMGEKVMVLFGINFSQKTDVSLARVFLQELDDSKRHVKNSVEAKFYPDYSRPPLELKDIEKNPKQFACGFISFSKILLIYI